MDKDYTLGNQDNLIKNDLMQAENEWAPHWPAKAHYAIIILFSIVLLSPAFVLGSGGFDLMCQSLWVKHFTQQFWQGYLYPRWMMDMYAGNGSPVFFYYPPLTYFITAFFAFLIPLDPFGYTAMAASALLATILAGLLFYRWMRRETGNPGAALLGSLLYISAPIDLGYDFYSTMLFSSLWAYAWIPLLFLCGKRLAHCERFGIVGFAFAIFLLVMTNLPLTVIWGPIVVLYSFYGWHRQNEKAWQRIWHWIWRPLVSVALGFALAAIYLVPMAFYMDYANINTHWAVQGYEHFFLLLGFTQLNQRIYSTYFLLLLGLTIFYGCVLRKQHRGQGFFVLISVAGLFMILPFSKPIWDAIPLLKVIQFSERFFLVPALCLAVLASFAPKRTYLLGVALVVMYSVSNVWLASWDTRISLEQFKHARPTLYEIYELNIDQYIHYLSSRRLVERFYTQKGIDIVKQHPEPVEVLDGDAVIHVKAWKPRHIELHYSATLPSTLRIRQFYYPGFVALMDGEELPMKRDRDSGQMSIDVPAGEGDILLELTELVPEIAGKGISLLALIGFMLLLIADMPRYRNTEAQESVPNDA